MKTVVTVLGILGLMMCPTALFFAIVGIDHGKKTDKES